MKDSPKLIPIGAEATASAEVEQATEIQSVVENWTINTPEERIKTGSFVAQLKDQKKELEKKRKAITDPLHKAKTEVMNLFRPAEKALDEARRTLEKVLARYDEDQERVRRKALVDAQGETDPTKARALVVAATMDTPPDEDLTVIKSWDFEVEDPTLVPRELCSPVASLIRQQVEAGNHKIPGVRVFEKTSYRRKPKRK